jgi:hypothetical protein
MKWEITRNAIPFLSHPHKRLFLLLHLMSKLRMICNTISLFNSIVYYRANRVPSSSDPCERTRACEHNERTSHHPALSHLYMMRCIWRGIWQTNIAPLYWPSVKQSPHSITLQSFVSFSMIYFKCNCQACNSEHKYKSVY